MVSETPFKEVHCSHGVINDNDLPDIQRPFVCANAEVRDLFDSMHRGCQWLTGAGQLEHL